MKIGKSLWILLNSFFILVLCLIYLSIIVPSRNLLSDYAYCENSADKYGDIYNNITFSYAENVYKIQKINTELSALQNKIFDDFDKRVDALNFAICNGIDIEKSFLYAFPEIVETVNEIYEQTIIQPEDAKISVIKNTAKIELKHDKNGIKIDKNALFFDILSNFNSKNLKNNFVINPEKIPAKIAIDEICDYDKLRGTFSTSFLSSTQARKNNIIKALAQFDGIVLNPGETLSFNQTTGIRNEEHGYQKAKIIKNGVFIEEFGGGVCQVSTTLYNAALLAGLEIVEVHPHSLPVSYIEPCFDAMVNMGSSDLIIKNNLEYPVIFATSSLADTCKVSIYGQYSNYRIVRRSEKIEEISPTDTVFTSDYLAYGFEAPLAEGEQKVLSYAKPGYKAHSWLEYYQDDILIKTEQLRSNTYSATNQVVMVGV